MTLFAVAGGITGRDHLRARRDGQDGFAVVETPSLAAAIVTDGCSSGAASEVGARLGAAWLRDLVTRELAHGDPVRGAARVTSMLVERLADAARSFGNGTIEPAIVGELFLFGFLVAAMTREHAIVFGVGDGIAWVDGRTDRIDPGPANAPTYAAYALLGAPITPRVSHVGPADEAQILAVATDGADELLRPGSAPTLDALVCDERLLRNPSLLKKQLIVLGDRGLLWDDTTVGVVRRAR